MVNGVWLRDTPASSAKIERSVKGQRNSVRSYDDKPGPRPLVLAMAAIGCMAFGISETVQRMNIEVDGVVISSQTTVGNRPVTFYVLRGPDGRESEYVAGATDKSLPRRLPEGTYLKKKKYQLSYIKNGEVIDDFPLVFYLTACGLGVLIGWWSYSQWRFNRALGKTPKRLGQTLK